MTDAAEIRPKLIPDDKLRARDNSGASRTCQRARVKALVPGMAPTKMARATKALLAARIKRKPPQALTAAVEAGMMGNWCPTALCHC